MRILSDILLRRWLLVIVVIILTLIPFHATLTVGLAHLFSHYTLFRLWKEGLLVLAVIISLALLVKDRSRASFFFTHPLLRPILLLVAVYGALHVVLGTIAILRGNVTAQALGYGAVSNLRYLMFFVVCLVAGSYYKEWVAMHWKKILLIPAGLVVLFGLLQAFVLPIDFLKHVGYGPETIAPYSTVDEKLEYVRAQSTLRGPNPLGAYLVIVITALVALFFRKRMRSWQLGITIIAALLVLYATYSRSAYIGVVLAIITLVWCMTTSKRMKKIFIIILAVLAIVGAGTIFVLRDNDHVQNALFHTDEHSQSSASSNESRGGVMIDGLRNVAAQPIGRGPGTAGPASVYNDAGSIRISENYFLQIAQEVGIVGLGIFLAICMFVGRALWFVRAWSILPVILLASLVGLSFVNLVSHAWADDTLAYMWWGLAGLTLGATVITDQKKKELHGKKTI
jgi:O-antigen ligase